MSKPSNAMNQQGSAGIVNWDGTSVESTTALTEYNVLTGASNKTVNNVAPSATSGVPLISQGSSSQPVFGTAVVAGGGTGNTSFTAYEIITGGTTTTGALQQVTDNATNQVLQSGGGSALPTFTATPTVTGITFGTGSELSVYLSEQTYSPAISSTGGGETVNYSSQSGVYTRIGSIVVVSGSVAVSSISGGSGQAQISLPLTANSTYLSFGSINMIDVTAGASVLYYNCRTQLGSTLMKITGYESNSSAQFLTWADLGSTPTLNFSITYFL